MAITGRREECGVSLEDQYTARKSLQLVTGCSADWADPARTCMCFAIGAGRQVLIGIKDGQTAPSPQQVALVGLIDQQCRRIGELTVKVQALSAWSRRWQIHRRGRLPCAKRVRQPELTACPEGTVPAAGGAECAKADPRN